MNPAVLTCRYGFLDQGLIFTCARAGQYAGCIVHGVVITARCDLAHSKVPLVNYLPVVRLLDWLRRDFIQLVTTRLRRDIEGRVATVLRTAGNSTSILETESLSSIADTLFPSSVRKHSKSRKALDDAIADIDYLNSLALLASDAISLPNIYSRFPKQSDALVRECVQQRLAGYYFLSAVSPTEIQSAGYVVLLREVQTLAPLLSNAIATGLDRSSYNSLCDKDHQCNSQLDFENESFAYPVGQLASPNIEHLMQTFAMLFIRIGLPDVDTDYFDKVIRGGFEADGNI